MIYMINIGDGDMYMENGQLHNEDAPAWVHANGLIEYYTHGKLNNPNGPARIFPDGRKEYWFAGVYQGVEKDDIFYPWKLQ